MLSELQRDREFRCSRGQSTPVSLGFFDLFILEGNLDAFACALHDEEVVDQLLGGRSEFFNTIFQIFLD